MENMKDYLPNSNEAENILNEIKGKFEQCVVAVKIKNKDGSEGNAIGVKCSRAFLAQIIVDLAKQNPEAFGLAKFFMEMEEIEDGAER